MRKPYEDMVAPVSADVRKPHGDTLRRFPPILSPGYRDIVEGELLYGKVTSIGVSIIFTCRL